MTEKRAPDAQGHRVAAQHVLTRSQARLRAECFRNATYHYRALITDLRAMLDDVDESQRLTGNAIISVYERHVEDLERAAAEMDRAGGKP